MSLNSGLQTADVLKGWYRRQEKMSDLLQAMPVTFMKPGQLG